MYLLEDMVNVTSVDLRGLDTTQTANMFDMFANCISLQSIDLSPLDLSNVTNLSFMFANCSALKTINLSGFNLKNAANMNYMFQGCRSLQSINLSGVQTPNLSSLEGTFEGCSALASIDLTSLNTSQVSTMLSLFSGCAALETANLASLQTPLLTDMRNMFYSCSKLRYLDLSSFDTTKVTQTDGMFEGCGSLAGITIGPKVTKLGQLPVNMLKSSDKWYSAKDGKWYTVEEIMSQRLGVADNYTTFNPAEDAEYDLSKAAATVSPTSFISDGTEKKPAVTVILRGIQVPAWGYDVSYKDNLKAGTATATATGKGLYHGQVSASFTIEENPDSKHAKSDLTSYIGKAKAAGFTDLDENDWCMKAPDGAFPNSNTLYLDYAIGRGLMSGYAGTTLFGPNDQLDRGMAATIIYRMATGKTAKTTDNNVGTKFNDVPSGQWYSAAVAWCAENGVVTGYKDDAENLTGLFGPGDPVSREQLATMIARYCEQVRGMPSAGTDLSRFPDQGQVNSWAREGVAFCVANGVVSGYTHNGCFGLQDGASRCQMSKIIAVTARMIE